MSFTSKLKLDARFFKPAERAKAFGGAAYQSAQNFRQSLKQKMIESVPAGRTQSIGKGTNFETRFRRSKRGQRPAIQTRYLLNSIRARRTSELSAETEVLAEYADELQNELGRKIMTDEDRIEAQTDFNRQLNRALLDLVLTN